MRQQRIINGILVGVFAVLSAVVLPASTTQATGVDMFDFKAWNSAWEFKQGSVEGGATVDWWGNAAVTLKKGAKQGMWTSPEKKIAADTVTLNPSWEAKTPDGALVKTQLRVKQNGAWSNWYKTGDWAFEHSAETPRTSYNDQSDDFGTIYTDTYVNTTDKKLESYQVRVELTAKNNAPEVRQLAVQAAPSREFSSVSRTTMDKTVDLNVPQYSQYTHSGEFPAFGGGGEAWCSPTSVAMVLGYYKTGPSARDIAALPADPVFNANGRKDGAVDYAAIHTYDTAYEGAGNWPFNTAYAASYGVKSAVRVLPTLRDIEKNIKDGNPTVVSIAWNNEDDNPSNDLPGAGISKSGGHLMVVRGFTKDGSVIANDPATYGGNGDVRRVYDRTAFERQWISASNGTAYIFSK